MVRRDNIISDGGNDGVMVVVGAESQITRFGEGGDEEGTH